jgi:hypothetical protein
VQAPCEQLKDASYLGDLEPGQHLIETPLAQAYAVSRTPIRETLTRLQQDRVVVRTGTSLTVRERSPGEVLDIYEVRILLEDAAGRTAAERRNNFRISLTSENREFSPSPPAGKPQSKRTEHHCPDVPRTPRPRDRPSPGPAPPRNRLYHHRRPRHAALDNL